MIYYILGIIFIIITYIVHKNTNIYSIEHEHFYKAKLPVWLLIIGIIIFMLPRINAFVFFIGLLSYVISYHAKMVSNDSKLILKIFDFCKKIINFFNKNIYEV
jgi:hypothetical protein